MSGYCYFNNAAIAADCLSGHGKIAILDIDFHHGNGTQDIFYERSDVLYVSIHADPHDKFPYISGFSDESGKGKGIGFNKNYPLALGTKDQEYLKVLMRALKDVEEFKPRYLVVSLGFDTYEKDPIGGFKITPGFYKEIARNIKGLELPTLLIQEGGYNVEDLGKLSYLFLQGME
ncbi:MAG: Histone deacetylase superfamily protein [uncultured bacterium]|nr:MAG: Histone deacetylase superfamily protein [uncultured bacterium]